MTDLVVIVPSRGRPEAAAELAAAFGETRTTARLVFAIDEDDPTRHAYARALGVYPGTTIYTGGAPATMVRALNAGAGLHANDAFAVGFMGDDHRPRTHGWQHIVRVLAEVKGHRGRAAEILGIDPKTLYRKIRAYRIPDSRRPGT